MSRTKRKPCKGWSSSLSPLWKEMKDKKAWFKANSTFKKFAKDKRKAKERAAEKKLLKDPEDTMMPRFRKENDYNYL